MRVTLSVKKIHDFIQEPIIMKTGIYLDQCDINRFMSDMEDWSFSKK